MEENATVYVLGVGTDGSLLKDDSSISVGGPALSRDLVVRLNDNPVLLYRGGGRLVQINQWLRKGTNTVSVSGITDHPVFVKLGRMEDAELDAIVINKRFEIDEIGRGARASFSADISYDLDIFQSENSVPVGVNVNVFHSFLVRLQGLAKARKYAEFADALFEEQERWSKSAYGQSQASVDAKRSFMEEFYKENEIETIVPDTSEMHLILGKSVVFVYAEPIVSMAGSGEQLGAMTAGSETNTLPPLKFAYLKGVWKVWE
jgi:hypothetical protein